MILHFKLQEQVHSQRNQINQNYSVQLIQNFFFLFDSCKEPSHKSAKVKCKKLSSPDIPASMMQQKTYLRLQKHYDQESIWYCFVSNLQLKKSEKSFPGKFLVIILYQELCPHYVYALSLVFVNIHAINCQINFVQPDHQCEKAASFQRSSSITS